jgi:YHS domain-containing protein
MRLVLLFVLAACGGSPKPAQPTDPGVPSEPAAKILTNVDASGVGLGGHDPVGYQSGAPVMGAPEHTAKHDGATYQFATAESKATFEGAAAQHAPQYGGYCAFAASQNRLSPSDPKVFLIYEGQLLVFTNQDFLDQFQKDPAGNKQKADANWPGLVAKHGKI